MIHLDFEEEEYLIDDSTDLKTIISTAIEHTCFIYPIVFVVNNIDFFLFEDKCGLGHFSMPIVNFAVDGLFSVRQLFKEKKYIF